MKARALTLTLVVGLALSLAAVAAAAVIDGTPGNDTLSGPMEPDVIRGFAGDDTSTRGDGNDLSAPGTGNDTVRGRRRRRSRCGGPATIASPPGQRRRRGVRRLGGRRHRRWRRPRPSQRRPGNDRVHGGPGDDRICGGPGADVAGAATVTTRLHALAADRRTRRAPLRPRPRHGRVRRSERATTRITGCETIVIVVTPTADDEAAESDRDADAE